MMPYTFLNQTNRFGTAKSANVNYYPKNPVSAENCAILHTQV